MSTSEELTSDQSQNPDLQRQVRELLDINLISYTGRASELFEEMSLLRERFESSDSLLQQQFIEAVSAYRNVFDRLSSIIGVQPHRLHKWTRALHSVVYPALNKDLNPWNLFQRWVKEQYPSWKAAMAQHDGDTPASFAGVQNIDSPPLQRQASNLTPPETPQARRILLHGEISPESIGWNRFSSQKWKEVQADAEALAEWKQELERIKESHQRTVGLNRRNDKRFVNNVVSGFQKLDNKGWAFQTHIFDVEAKLQGAAGCSREIVSERGAAFVAVREQSGFGRTDFENHCIAEAVVAEAAALAQETPMTAPARKFYSLLNSAFPDRRLAVGSGISAEDSQSLPHIQSHISPTQRYRRRATTEERKVVVNRVINLINTEGARNMAAQGKPFERFRKWMGPAGFDEKLRQRADCAIYIRKELRSSISRPELYNLSTTVRSRGGGRFYRALANALDLGNVVICRSNPDVHAFDGPMGETINEIAGIET